MAEDNYFIFYFYGGLVSNDIIILVNYGKTSNGAGMVNLSEG